MQIEISHCLERVWVKVVDSLGDECVMLLKVHELHQLNHAIEKFLAEQPLRTAKEAMGGGK